MSIPVRLTNNTVDVKITPAGAIVTAPFSYDEIKAETLAVNDQAYNMFPPKVGCFFVITGILLSTDRLVGNNGAVIDVYEGLGESATAITKSILSVDLPKQENRDVIPLNIRVGAGRWVNAKTDDNNVSITITGYYVPLEPK